MCLFRFIKIRWEVILPVYVLTIYFYIYHYDLCCCAIACQHSILNRLFGCVSLVWRHHLWKVNKSSVHSFRRFFLQFFYFLMFLNIHIYFIILKTYDQQCTLTTKKSLHIIFKMIVSVVFSLKSAANAPKVTSGGLFRRHSTYQFRYFFMYSCLCYCYWLFKLCLCLCVW